MPLRSSLRRWTSASACAPRRAGTPTWRWAVDRCRCRGWAWARARRLRKACRRPLCTQAVERRPAPTCQGRSPSADGGRRRAGDGLDGPPRDCALRTTRTIYCVTLYPAVFAPRAAAPPPPPPAAAAATTNGAVDRSSAAAAPPPPPSAALGDATTVGRSVGRSVRRTAGRAAGLAGWAAAQVGVAGCGRAAGVAGDGGCAGQAVHRWVLSVAVAAGLAPVGGCRAAGRLAGWVPGSRVAGWVRCAAGWLWRWVSCAWRVGATRVSSEHPDRRRDRPRELHWQ